MTSPSSTFSVFFLIFFDLMPLDLSGRGAGIGEHFNLISHGSISLMEWILSPV